MVEIPSPLELKYFCGTPPQNFWMASKTLLSTLQPTQNFPTRLKTFRPSSAHFCLLFRPSSSVFYNGSSSCGYPSIRDNFKILQDPIYRRKRVDDFATVQGFWQAFTAEEGNVRTVEVDYVPERGISVQIENCKYL